jgi:hypothetical protein
MKKLFIGSLVGAIILFVWSFLAWQVLPLHLHTYAYTPAQDSILKVLGENNLETGVYAMPMMDNRNLTSMSSEYMKECHEFMEANKGKPMATLTYIKEGMDMGPGMIVRGFLIEWLTILAACILLMPAFAASSTFFGRWWLTLVTGLLISAAGPLIYYNFMGWPWNYTIDIIVDIFLNWGIVGLWLAWYFRK